MASRDSIKVVCRIRPENAIEKGGSYKRCVEHNKTDISVNCETTSGVSDMKGMHKFTFDRVFGSEASQADVFTEVAVPAVDGVINGYNGTIFCYGQTGSGKSFTMEGGSMYDPVTKGLIPRMFEYIFERISSSNQAIEFNIKCSYLEIYMEKICDLLDAKKTNLQVKEDKTRGLYVQDATEVYVQNPEEMYQVMRSGQQNRSVAATRMNAVSSRSHSIFLVTILQKNTETDTSKMGKLYCCDLAGSEKVEKTEAKGQTLEEAKMINKSLSALGNVINALTEAKKSGFIPYRDSKLTRMLQESLGGNSATCLVITASYSQYNDRETLSTLRFGMRAKSIKNKIKQNTERSAKELLICLNQAEQKIGRISDLVAMIQAKLKQVIAEAPEDEREAYEKFVEQAMHIATAKDLDILLAQLKGDKSDALLQAMAEGQEGDASEPVEESKGEAPVAAQDSQLETPAQTQQEVAAKEDQAKVQAPQPLTQDTFIQPIAAAEEQPEPNKEGAQVADAKTKQTLKDRAAKIYKQHAEIVKLRHELVSAADEKKQLEEEIRTRNEEVYQMNEKMIFIEFQKQAEANRQLTEMASGKVQDLRLQLEKCQDNNIRRIVDLQKLRKSLNRLKNDLYVFKLSKRLQSESQSRQAASTTNETEGQTEEEGATEGTQASAADVSKNSGGATIDSDKMVSEQIQQTMEAIQKMEASLTSELIMQESKDRSKARRSAGNSPVTLRSRSQIVDSSIRVDSTMVTELEYLNMLPGDLSRVNESSFLQGIGNNTTMFNTTKQTSDGVSAQVASEQNERIKQLEDQLIEHQKQIEELEEEKRSQSASDSASAAAKSETERSGTESAAGKDQSEIVKQNQEQKQELTILRDQLRAVKKQHEMELLNVKSSQADELKRLQMLLGSEVDKRAYFDLENNFKLLEDKNRALMSELIQLRRANDQKEQQMERMEKRVATAEKNLAMVKIHSQRNIMPAGGNPFPAATAGFTPVQTASGQIQFQAAAGPFAGQGNNNQMDLLFNRKVVKPIRGGAAAPGGGSSKNRSSNLRENSQGRTSLSKALTFDQFMTNQSGAGTYSSQRPGRASVGALRSPPRPPPLVKPDQQEDFKKHMRTFSNKKGVAKQMKQYKANMDASRQMVHSMKMQEAQALAEMPLEETLISESSSEKDYNEEDDGDSTPRDHTQEEEDKAEVERQIKKARYASQGPKKAANQKSAGKVYGQGQPIVPPSPKAEQGLPHGQKKSGLKKIFGGIKKLF